MEGLEGNFKIIRNTVVPEFRPVFVQVVVLVQQVSHHLHHCSFQPSLACSLLWLGLSQLQTFYLSF